MLEDGCLPLCSKTRRSTNPGLKHPGRFEAREVRPHRGRASGDGRRLILQGTTGLSLRLVPTLEAGILDYGVQGFVPALSTAILAQDLVNDRSRFAFCWRTYCWASTIPSFLISVAGMECPSPASNQRPGHTLPLREAR